MLNADLKFDKNRKRVLKCPCGKHGNKDGKFTPFIGYYKKGFCHSCQKTFMPEIECNGQESSIVKATPVFPYLELPRRLMEKSCSLYTDNFSKYLIRLFGIEEALRLKRKFRIGSSLINSAVTLFWLVDENNKVRTAKMMKYDTNGNRLNYNNFLHSVLLKNGSIPSDVYRVKIPLYGLDQLMFKNVAIVESEKTAAIMSMLSPELTWLACSGASGLTYDKLRWMKDTNVYLIPDLGQFDNWTQKANYFNDVIRSCSFSVLDISKVHELKQHTDLGYDILDYCLKVDPLYGVALSDYGYPKMWDL